MSVRTVRYTILVQTKGFVSGKRFFFLNLKCERGLRLASCLVVRFAVSREVSGPYGKTWGTSSRRGASPASPCIIARD